MRVSEDPMEATATGRIGFSRAVLASAAPLVVAAFPLFLTGALGVRLREEFGFGEARLGLAVGMVPATGAVVAVLMGRLVHRVGAPVALRLGAAVAATSMLGAAWFTTSYGMLLVFLVISGLGVAVAFPATDFWISRTVERSRQGLAVAIKQSATQVAGLFAGLAVPAFAVTLGWRWAFVVGAAAAFLAIFSVPRGVPMEHASGEVRSGGDVSVRTMVLVAIALGLGQMSVFSLIGFSVSAAVDAGIAESTAGVVFAVGNVLGIASRLRPGHLADLRAARNQLYVAAGLLAAGGVCFGLLATASPTVMLVAIPLAFATGWGWPGLVFLAVIRANPNAPAVASSIAVGGGNVGAFIGPFVFGALAAGSFAVAWSVAAVSAWVAAAAMAAAGRMVARNTAVPAPSKEVAP